MESITLIGDEPLDGYIYVIGGDHPLIKIGYAKNVERRMGDFQPGSPVVLKVLFSCPGSLRMEQWLHRNFVDRRAHGEWFRMRDPKQIERIRDAAERYVQGDYSYECDVEDLGDPEVIERWRSLRSRQRSTVTTQ